MLTAVDSRTLQYYDAHAEAVFARHTRAGTGVAKYFRTAFPAGARVLDIGSGSGRDLNTLVAEQYQAYGVEPSEPLRARAGQGFPLKSTHRCTHQGRRICTWRPTGVLTNS